MTMLHIVMIMMLWWHYLDAYDKLVLKMTFAVVVFWLAEYEQRRLRKLVQQCCWCYSRVYMMCWDDLQQVINLESGFSVCCLMCIHVWAEIDAMTSSRDDAPRWWSTVMTSWRWAEKISSFDVSEISCVTQVYCIVKASLSFFWG